MHTKKTRYLTTLLLAAILLFYFAPAAKAGVLDRFKYALSPWISVELDVAYGNHPQEKMDVIRPSWTNQAPAIVMIHGGGWTIGDKLNMAGEASRLAKAGFAVFNLNYRLAQTGEADTLWPAQLQDVQLAVRWIRHNAGRLGTDPNHLCSLGASAGGHLAMFLGYAKTIQPGDRDQDLKKFSPQVSCVVNLFGPANLSHEAVAKVYGKLPFVAGGSEEEVLRRLRQASPLYFISETSPPTLIIQPKEDTIVPPALAKELVEVLKMKNVPHSYIEVEGGHGYEGTPESEQLSVKEATLRFLETQLAPSKDAARENTSEDTTSK